MGSGSSPASLGARCSSGTSRPLLTPMSNSPMNRHASRIPHVHAGQPFETCPLHHKPIHGNLFMSDSNSGQPLDYRSPSTVAKRPSCFFSAWAVAMLAIGLVCGLLAGEAGLNPVEGSVISPWLADRPTLLFVVGIPAYPGMLLGMVLGELLPLPSYTLAICIGQACVYWPVGALLAYMVRRRAR